MTMPDKARTTCVPVTAALDGERLDRALMALCGLSLRAARRRLTDGGIRVDGQPATAARRLRAGQMIELPADDRPDTDNGPEEAAVTLLARHGDYVAFAKPAGLHSSPLAGRATPTLEAAAQRLWDTTAGPAPLHFLQRLDRGTSGIVCAALSEAAARRFREEEADGRWHKCYLALLRGELHAPLTADRALDVSNRRSSRVLDKAAPPLRHTRFFPLRVLHDDAAAAVLAASGLPPEESAVTLAACIIHCGARHQIRAHAASLGLPLCGDRRYAGPPNETPPPGPERFLLHHACLSGPGGRWLCLPAWPYLPLRENHFRKWLETHSRYDTIPPTENARAARSPVRGRA